MSGSIVIEKAEKFSVRIVRCSHYIRYDKKEYSLADQLLRSGTSICANLYEGKFAQSNADFINKLSISLKEASETDFWIKLLNQTGYIEDNVYESLNNDVTEIIKLLVSIIKKLKDKGS
jgi:four helix bundle protein